MSYEPSKPEEISKGAQVGTLIMFYLLCGMVFVVWLGNMPQPWVWRDPVHGIIAKDGFLYWVIYLCLYHIYIGFIIDMIFGKRKEKANEHSNKSAQDR